MARTLTLTRVFDAPRDLVFAAWTDPRHIAAWWGPRGFTNPKCVWEARPGGKINVVMRASDEIAQAIGMKDHPMGGEFREVVKNSKLVFITTAFEQADGSAALRNLNTVTFEDHGGKTKVTLHVIVEHAAPEMEGALAGMEQGWMQSLDKLAERLAQHGKDNTMLNPYIFFDGNCEEAFKTYEKILGGKIEALLPYGDMAKTAPGGEALRNKIMHGALKVGDGVLMGSDNGMGNYTAPAGFRVSFTVKTPADAERVFAGLSEGGKVTMPMQQTFFSARFGQLTDKFGIPWMVNCAQQN